MLRHSRLIVVVLALCIAGGMALWLWPQPTAAPAWESTTVTVSETTLSNMVLSEQTYTMDDLLSAAGTFSAPPEGGLPWKVFGATGQESYTFKTADGYDGEGLRPLFTPALKKHDGTAVTVQGYMFPLESSERQALFLLGPFPVSCPFHYHVTPNLIIEVHARKPVTFSYDPVTLGGILELVAQDDENNVFFRLKDAVVLPTEK